MIKINDHAHIRANKSGGYELFADVTVMDKATKENKVKRIGGQYYATFSGALNGYMKTARKTVSASDELNILQEVLLTIQDLKSLITQTYKDHI